MPPLPPAPRALLTGAGSGLGRALALRLARRRGARLLLTDVDLAAAENAADEARALGADADALACDAADSDAVAAAADAMDARFGGVDLVVNNAGVAAAGAIGEVPLDDWRWLLDINLRGVIYGCHHVVPRLRAQGRGWVLNVSSSAGFASLPEMGPYNVAKAGVIALSETLAAEVARDGVAVSVLCPTFFRTNLAASLRSPGGRHRALVDRLVGRAHVDADAVAAAALDGLEAGRFMIIPQRDGRLVWRAKRLLPDLYRGALGRLHGGALARRVLG